MKTSIQSAIKQFKENDFYNTDKTEQLFVNQKELYEKAKNYFFKTCPICYEISSYESFCNCKIECETLCDGCEEITAIDTWFECKDNAFNRLDLIDFIKIYEGAERSIEKIPIENTFRAFIYSVDYEIHKQYDGKNFILFDAKLDSGSAKGEVVKAKLILLKSLEFIKRNLKIGDLVFLNHRMRLSTTEPNKYIHYFDINPNDIMDKEDLKILEDAFKVDIKNETELKNKVDIVSNKYSFIKDILLPIITYIFFIQLPLVIFISTFFFNKGNIFGVSKEVFQGTFMTAFIGVLFLFSPIIQELKNERLKLLFSEKSFKIHFLISIILIGISAFQLLLPFAMTVVLLTVILYSKKIISFIKDKLK